MPVSSAPLMPRRDVEEYLKSMNFPPSEIEAGLAHPLGLAFDGPDGKKVILLNRGDGYEKVDPDEFEDQTRTARQSGITAMQSLADEPGEPKGRRIGSSMPLKQGTVFFSAPSIAPQMRQTVEVGSTLSFPIEARNFTGDSTTIKCDPFPLPAGASFTDQGDGTGIFTFTPHESQVGSYDFIFTASDGIQQLSQSVIVTVVRPPVTKPVGRPNPEFALPTEGN